MKLESLGLEKFRKEELSNLAAIKGGTQVEPAYETGCADAPDCCTGADCSDDEPME
ncbi:hypothetical protein [Flavobacterium pectinovorum]|uniref:hypothetical protein n=1 Tax=Flavobacterium pectinovorum TaxID=29533 RepID=UPI001375FCC4|nr:hypothetical protein [Flavobacterium pectinovorum]